MTPVTAMDVPVRSTPTTLSVSVGPVRTFTSPVATFVFTAGVEVVGVGVGEAVGVALAVGVGDADVLGRTVGLAVGVAEAVTLGVGVAPPVTVT